MKKQYEVVIIGAGVAGLTAGIYASRSGLRTLVVEKAGPGGQIIRTEMVENYPGFPEGISGYDLVEKIKAQAERFGVIFAAGDIGRITAAPGGGFLVPAVDGEEYTARSVIIASGAAQKMLGVPGEERLTGRGVSYCATCDGPLFRGREVVVVGGGDSAVGEAIYLAKLAKKVYLVHRREQFRAAKILQDRLLGCPNVELRLNCTTAEITGEDRVTGIRINNLRSGAQETIPVSGIFIYVGLLPNTDFLKGVVKLDEKGFIVTDALMETSMPGVFACGDARANIFKQVVVACGEGAIAADSSWHYIEGLNR
ncbi:MAG: thioredoxin-disulfide reductase [Candidatus Omnitrophota bacterium]